MRVAIESAALVVDKRWRVRPTPEVFNLISDPPQISPQRPRAFRRERIQLIFVIFISHEQARAICKKLIPHGPWFDYEICKNVVPASAGSTFSIFDRFHQIAR